MEPIVRAPPGVIVSAPVLVSSGVVTLVVNVGLATVLTVSVALGPASVKAMLVPAVKTRSEVRVESLLRVKKVDVVEALPPAPPEQLVASLIQTSPELSGSVKL